MYCMTIWAGKGDRIRFANTEGVGLKDEILGTLTLDKTYAFDRMVVYEDSTRVWVKDGSRTLGPFNSIFFEDVMIDRERANERKIYAHNYPNALPFDTNEKSYGSI